MNVYNICYLQKLVFYCIFIINRNNSSSSFKRCRDQEKFILILGFGIIFIVIIFISRIVSQWDNNLFMEKFNFI